jgi:hypothetical protein
LNRRPHAGSPQGLPASATQCRAIEQSNAPPGLAQFSNLVARHAYAVITGSGLIRVTATASLNATVSGSGAIIYSGNPPQVTRSITGTGTVIPG